MKTISTVAKTNKKINPKRLKRKPYIPPSKVQLMWLHQTKSTEHEPEQLSDWENAS